MITGLLNTAARRYIKKYIEQTLTKIEVEPGATCLYNYKCHLNAVHNAKMGISHPDKVYMVMEIEHGCDWPIIHFINRDLEDTCYVDNTYGYWSTNYDYYLVKGIPAQDFMSVSNRLGNFRDELRCRLPWYLRILSNVNH